MMKRLLMCLVVAFPALVSAEDSSIGPDLELICPCTVESASSSSIISDFGVINRGSAGSGELIVRVYAHIEENYHDAQNATFLANFYVSSSLGATSQLDISEHRARLAVPEEGDYYITLLLLEDLFVVDETRTSGQVTFGDNLRAESSGTDLYLVDDPTISVNGATVTLNWPGLGNGSTTDENVEVRIVATETPRFLNSFQTLAQYDGVCTTRTNPPLRIMTWE